jgi:hypothetical protein
LSLTNEESLCASQAEEVDIDEHGGHDRPELAMKEGCLAEPQTTDGNIATEEEMREAAISARIRK